MYSPEKHITEYQFHSVMEEMVNEERKLVQKEHPTPEEWMKLATNSFYETKIYLAEREDTPQEILEILSNLDKSMQYFVACNPNVSDETLLKLSFSDNPLIRETAQEKLMKRFETS